MIRRNAATDTEHPPGQTVYRPEPATPVTSKNYKPTHGGFPDADKRTQAEWDRFQKERNEQAAK